MIYQSCISSHFDLSSLISMARKQSAPKEDSIDRQGAGKLKNKKETKAECQNEVSMTRK